MLTTATLRRALIVLLLAVPLVVTGGAASAAPCSATRGVTVVVEYRDHIQTGCAQGDPTSGAAALVRAGFAVTPVTGQPFVCRIAQQPNVPCNDIPPADAYWAYFSAQPGGHWSYESQGPFTSDPAPGSVEGWRFGTGAKPSIRPSAAARAVTSAQPVAPPSRVAAPLTASGPDQHGDNVPWLWGLVGVVVAGGTAGAVTFARRR